MALAIFLRPGIGLISRRYLSEALNLSGAEEIFDVSDRDDSRYAEARPAELKIIHVVW
jgi:hypothetical protein